MSNINLDRSTKIRLLMPAFYATSCMFYFLISWPTDPKIYHVVGAFIAVSAFVLWIVSRIQLGNAFTITPQSKFLVKTGIYSKLRHPVYYCSIFALIGIGLYIWQLWVLVPLLSLLVLQSWRIQKEETVLSSTFGEEYKCYKKSTWM